MTETRNEARRDGGTPTRRRRLPAATGPVILLVVLVMALSAGLARLTGGVDPADDGPALFALSMHPLAPWAGYSQLQLSVLWGAFPPLLPFLFGAPVRAWSHAVSPFWAIRLGCLTWSILLLGVLDAVLIRVRGMNRPGRIRVLYGIALIPTFWATASLIPEEENYVALFVLLVVAGLAAGEHRSDRARTTIAAATMVLAILAAKYFLLVLAFPIALWSRRPLRTFGSVAGLAAAALATHEVLQFLLLGHAALVGYALPPSASLSIWGLLWRLGLRTGVGAGMLMGCGLATAASLLAAVWLRRRGAPVDVACATVLAATLVFLPNTFPGYDLWYAPLVLSIAIGSARGRRRIALVAAAYAWAVGAGLSNVLRGTALALSVPRGPAKTAVVDALLRALGLGAGALGVLETCAVTLTIAASMVLVASLMTRPNRSGATTRTPAASYPDSGPGRGCRR